MVFLLNAANIGSEAGLRDIFFEDLLNFIVLFYFT